MADAQAVSKIRPRIATVTGWTILFFVLLRVAIGWHFLYEGVWKIKSGTFSATPYLYGSVGPLRPYFRAMIDDADGFKRMGVERDSTGAITKISPDYQKQQIKERVALMKAHYELDADQAKVLDKLAQKSEVELDRLYGVLTDWQAKQKLDPALATQPAPELDQVDKDLFNQIIAYDQLLKQVEWEEKSQDPRYNQQRLEYNNKKVTDARNAILARVETWSKSPPREKLLEPRVVALTEYQIDFLARQSEDARTKILEKAFGVELTPAQLARGPLPMPQATHFPGKQLAKLGMPYKVTTRTEWQDLGMMFGLTAIGACLILGLFTRFAAFCGCCFLAMFYFSMPPWPGVQEVSPLEGHYLIVNKNLIELFACLMIMSSGVGRWLGLDSFLFARKLRRRMRRAEQEAVILAQKSSDRVYIPGERPRETARA